VTRHIYKSAALPEGAALAIREKDQAFAIPGAAGR
jgi:hypothetical protein